jgi:hypothetical protein
MPHTESIKAFSFFNFAVEDWAFAVVLSGLMFI